MFSILNQYLFQHKELVIPALGSFALIPRTASSDFSTRSIIAPGWDIVLHTNEMQIPSNFYEWLCTQMNSSKEDAVLKFDDFASLIVEKLHTENDIQWEGLGRLKRKADQKIEFIPENDSISPFTQVIAQKVFRENANHTMKVGETETTTQSMMEQLNRKKRELPLARIVALALLAISIIAMVLYFFMNGFNLKSIGNTQKADIQKSTETYKLK